MSTTHRRARKQHAGRITPEAIAAFKDGDAVALRLALRLPPWQISPLDVDPEYPCPYSVGCAGQRTWQDSLNLQEALHGHA